MSGGIFAPNAGLIWRSVSPPDLGRRYPSQLHFSAGTIIGFTMPQHGNATQSNANPAGVVVITAFDGMLDAGVHAVRIAGPGLPDGAYLYRLVAGESTTTGTIVKR